MIKACTVLLGFQEKLGLYKYHRGYGKFEYFPNLPLLSSKSKSENELLIYINHLQNIEEDWKSRFCDLQGIADSDNIISPFKYAIELTAWTAVWTTHEFRSEVIIY